MPELEEIGVRKWVADFGGIAPTLDSYDDVNIGDIALDNSQTPHALWECIDNTQGSPIWRKLYGNRKLVRTITGGYAAALSDEVIMCDTSAMGAAMVVTLPDATLCEGQTYQFKFVNGTEIVEITPQVGQLVDGAVNYPLPVVGSYVKIMAYNGNWTVID